MMFESASSGSTPKRVAIAAIRSGRNVPSVSMNAACMSLEVPESVGVAFVSQ
jgi:hypothetical protein